ncbi:MAG TPA: DUF4097 family beta strand repeat-containing protein, partial [Thermoanaerobaculia bacterium]|nr:DUF4097 family beta strand repeat-containing protein [Thermoanaerobaculia bacterium]
MNRTRSIAVACALALLVAASPALAVELEKRLEKTYDLGAGGEVAVRNVNGAVVVEGWDRDVVRVEAVKKVRAGSRERAEEALERLEVRVKHEGDRLEIRTHRPDSSSGFLSWVFGRHVQGDVRYTVTVPRRTDVEIDTVNGRVTIRGVAGEVEADTTNGRIDVEDVRGSVDAGTTNGAITVALRAVEEGRAMRFSTTNGSIQLSLPRSARVSLDASTTNGGIDLDDLPADVR